MFTMSDVLREEVNPVPGCFEPRAVALVVSRACEELSGTIEWLDIVVSNRVHKYGVTEGVPYGHGLRGNDAAAALAVFCGRSAYGLDALRDALDRDVESARAFLAAGKVRIRPVWCPDKVLVEVTAISGDDIAIVSGQGYRFAVRWVKKNDVEVYRDTSTPVNPARPIAAAMAHMDFSSIASLAENLTPKDVEYIWQGIDMNLALAQDGFNRGLVELAGSALLGEVGDSSRESLSSRIRRTVMAATGARMAGTPLPVMGSSNAGNHGINAILPVALAGAFHGKSREDIAKSVAYGHLAASFVKSRISRPLVACGCSVVGGTAAAAGLVRLMGGTLEQSEWAMTRALSTLTGIFCDGAKMSCMGKVGLGAIEALQAASEALLHQGIDSTQGIVDISDLSRTVKNSARIYEEGMGEVEAVLAGILSDRFTKGAEDIVQ